MKGKIYLIPVTLGGSDVSAIIPEKVLEITRGLRYFVVEEIRSARRYLRLIDKQFPIDDSCFRELNEHTREKDITAYLEPALNGNNMGLMSEAGLPCIADPGARLIAIAHREKIKVVPLSGPSSILMALISSGMNGQKFTFNGYLPVKSEERIKKLRELEKKAREGYTQIFMETPYRNQKILNDILKTCSNDINLCIASDLTLPTESIITRKLPDWKSDVPDLNKKMVIFVLQ